MEDIISKIKSSGHWRIVVRPTVFKKDRVLNLTNCRHIIEGNTVRYGGWEFPEVNRNNYHNLNDGIESSIEIKMFLEYWKFFQSGQFAFLSRFYEDEQIDDIPKYGSLPFSLSTEDLKNAKFSCIEFIINRITILYEFVRRLINQDALGNDFEIITSLNGVKDRILFFFNRSRILSQTYKCKIENIVFTKTFNSNNFLAKEEDLVIECCAYILERYNCYLGDGIIREISDKIRNS